MMHESLCLACLVNLRCPNILKFPFTEESREQQLRGTEATESAFQPEGAVASAPPRLQLNRGFPLLGVPEVPLGIQVVKANKDDLDVKSERAVWHKASPV